MGNPDNAARGWVVWLLFSNDGLSRAMSFRTLMNDMDDISGMGRSARQIHALCDYLEAKGYVKNNRRRDIPGWERRQTGWGEGRATDIITVQLTSKGDDLAQRNIPDDPGVELP